MKTKKLADFQICISVTLRLSQLAIEHSLVVMTAGSHPNQENPRLNPMVIQFPISILLNLSSESVGASNFEILVEDSDTNNPSSITVRMKYLVAFQF